MATPVDENAAFHQFELALVGHLTVASLESAIAEQLAKVPATGFSELLVDCSALLDYDVDARARFTKWLGSERHRLTAIAIVTDRQLYHLVIAAMALASRMNIKAFDGRAAAERWLAADHARRVRRGSDDA